MLCFTYREISTQRGLERVLRAADNRKQMGWVERRTERCSRKAAGSRLTGIRSIVDLIHCLVHLFPVFVARHDKRERERECSVVGFLVRLTVARMCEGEPKESNGDPRSLVDVFLVLFFAAVLLGSAGNC